MKKTKSSLQVYENFSALFSFYSSQYTSQNLQMSDDETIGEIEQSSSVRGQSTDSTDVPAMLQSNFINWCAHFNSIIFSKALSISWLLETKKIREIRTISFSTVLITAYKKAGINQYRDIC